MKKYLNALKEQVATKIIAGQANLEALKQAATIGLLGLAAEGQKIVSTGKTIANDKIAQAKKLINTISSIEAVSVTLTVEAEQAAPAVAATTAPAAKAKKAPQSAKKSFDKTAAKKPAAKKATAKQAKKKVPAMKAAKKIK